jgi:Domain of unknown function (DUF5666)
MIKQGQRGRRGWLAAGAATIAAAATLTAAQAASAIQFEGPVLSKNRDAKTFRMNPENHSNVTIKVNGGTTFQRIDGFGGLHRGLDVEVRASRVDGHWVAAKIEKHTGGGGGGEDR